jgi:hypothetical protein
MTRIFTGDYCTGNFSQWATVQNRIYRGAPSDYYPYEYPARIISADKDCGYVARFEVRAGDVPDGAPTGERSAVGEATATTLTPVDTTRWYAFSIKFDSTFLTNHTSLGWAVTNQWHSDVLASSPTIFWGFEDAPAGGGPDGYWSLFQQPQSAPLVYLGNVRLLDIPMNVGNWIDVKMEVHWSPVDADGYVRVWVNGVRQSFLTGGTTFTGRTAIPGDAYIHYHEGLYREVGIVPTGIIYHAGFRMADSEDSL